jgi:hypothetical protein
MFDRIVHNGPHTCILQSNDGKEWLVIERISDKGDDEPGYWAESRDNLDEAIKEAEEWELDYQVTEERFSHVH